MVTQEGRIRRQHSHESARAGHAKHAGQLVVFVDSTIHMGRRDLVFGFAAFQIKHLQLLLSGGCETEVVGDENIYCFARGDEFVEGKNAHEATGAVGPRARDVDIVVSQNPEQAGHFGFRQCFEEKTAGFGKEKQGAAAAGTQLGLGQRVQAVGPVAHEPETQSGRR